MSSINNSLNFFFFFFGWRYSYEKDAFICKNSDVHHIRNILNFIFLALLCACIQIS